MKIKKFVLDGFKSYGDRTEITDWDEHFNCVTGRNGSGKSNIMDALTFVLGLSALKEVRATKLNELIYNKMKGRRQCSVSVFFDNSDTVFSPSGYENSREIVVTRQILTTISTVGDGTKEDTISMYRINGSKVETAQIRHLFQSVQLNIQNPNFLVRQGEAMRVIEAAPKTLLRQIEEAANTYNFQLQAIESGKELNRCETDIKAYTVQINENIRPRITQLQEKQLKYHEIKDQHDTLKIAERLIPAEEYDQLKAKKSKLKGKIEKENEVSESHTVSLNVADEECSALKSQLKQLRETLRDFQADGDLSARHQELTALITGKQIEMEDLSKSLAAYENETAECAHIIETSSTQLAGFSSSDEKVIEEHEITTKQLEITRQELETTSNLLAGLETGVSASGERDSGYASQMRTIRSKIADLTAQIQKGEEQLKSLDTEVTPAQYKASKVEVEKLRETEAQVKEQLANKQSEIEAAKAANSTDESAGATLDKLKAELRKIEQDLFQLRRRDSRLEFKIPGFSSNEIRGLVGHLFSIKPEFLNQSTALEVCAGGNLFNVVVSSDDVGTRLLNSGLRRRVTLLPLNKIRAFELNANKVANAKRIAPNPSDVELAVNAITYSKEVETAMKFVFGSTLIASDSKLANKVTFDQSVRARTISKAGDVYDPSGTLSGGAAASSSGVLKLFQQYNELTARQASVSKQIEGAGNQASKAAAGRAKLGALTSELQKIEINLRSIAQKLNEGPHARNVKTFEQNLENKPKLDEEIAQWKQGLKQEQANLAKVQKDSAEYSSDKDGKLAEIRSTIKSLKKQEAELDKKIQVSSKKYFKLKSSRTSLEHEIKSSSERIEQIKGEITAAQESKAQCERNIAHLQVELEKVESDMTLEMAKRDEDVDKIKEIESHIAHFETEISNAKMAIQIASQNLEALNESYNKVKQAMYDLQKQYKCIEEDQDKFGVTGGLYDYAAESSARMNELRRILTQRQAIKSKWAQIPSNFGEELKRAQDEYADITSKVKRLESDKSKILGTIADLTQKRHEEIGHVYKEISESMGQIFNTMLPGCSCKLVKANEEDVMAGLKIKARIGPNWKENVSELSGGQKSLAGLCFIFAMLKHRPAPFYILDEVDAALDLQHTQNLGVVFKTLFSESQFIVVSLKENMFSNADMIFKVENENGCSKVTKMKSSKDKSLKILKRGREQLDH